VDGYCIQKKPVEGSGVFKLNNAAIYILMCDLYTSQHYEFKQSTGLFQFTQLPESFTKNFNLRLGTVISISNKEAKRLNEKWVAFRLN
jgi:arabinoxylan arabinofuranohydrolase